MHINLAQSGQVFLYFLGKSAQRVAKESTSRSSHYQQILDDRYGKKAIIIASQLPVSDWYAFFKNELIAEACLDRIIHKATRLDSIGMDVPPVSL